MFSPVISWSSQRLCYTSLSNYIITHYNNSLLILTLPKRTPSIIGNRCPHFSQLLPQKWRRKPKWTNEKSNPKVTQTNRWSRNFVFYPPPPPPYCTLPGSWFTQRSMSSLNLFAFHVFAWTHDCQLSSTGESSRARNTNDKKKIHPGDYNYDTGDVAQW